jgi:monoamine oxidase
MNPFLLIRLQLMINRIERARKKVPAAEPWNMEGAEKLDATTVEAWRRQWVRNPKLLGVMDAAVRTIFGSEASELSLLHFLQYLNSSGGLMPLIEVEGGFQQDRIKGGAQQISEGLLARVGSENLSLNAPITAIEQDDDSVICRSGERSFKGRFCVVSMPLALIDRIAFAPPMPVRRDQLTQRTHMGATVKCFALYPKAFWRDKDLSGEVVCGDGPITVVYDNTDADGRQPCLLAFVVGRFARSWSEKPAEERRQQILGAFVRYFGPEAAQPSEYLEMDWSTEAYSGGCPISTFPPGTLSQFGSVLRAPVGRLHWAGTETAREFTGFMEGALESGDRAAQEVLGRL